MTARSSAIADYANRLAQLFMQRHTQRDVWHLLDLFAREIEAVARKEGLPPEIKERKNGPDAR